MVVRVRVIDVKGIESVHSLVGCLGTGLRLSVVGECGCSLGRAGEREKTNKKMRGVCKRIRMNSGMEDSFGEERKWMEMETYAGKPSLGDDPLDATG